MEGEYLYMERDFIAGDTDEPKGQSFLERDQVSYCKYFVGGGLSNEQRTKTKTKIF